MAKGDLSEAEAFKPSLNIQRRMKIFRSCCCCGRRPSNNDAEDLKLVQKNKSPSLITRRLQNQSRGAS